MGQLSNVINTGIIIGVSTILVIDFYRAVSELKPGGLVHLEHKSIGDSIRLAAAMHGHFDHLRVFASTSEVILPAVRDCGLVARLCQVMVQDFSLPSTDPKRLLLNAKTVSLIDTWRDLIGQGVLRELVVKRYDFMPTHYMVMFDDKRLVAGLFVPTDLQAHAVDYYNPWMLDDSTPEGKVVIQKYMLQFDALFARYEEDVAKSMTSSILTEDG